MTIPVGIEKIGVYPCSLALEMTRLCAARGHDPADIRDTMMIDERALNPVWEDPVTMAVNAANLVLTEADREHIELLIVASENSVVQEGLGSRVESRVASRSVGSAMWHQTLRVLTLDSRL